MKDSRPHSAGLSLCDRVGSAMGSLNDGNVGQGLDVGDLYMDGYMN